MNGFSIRTACFVILAGFLLAGCAAPWDGSVQPASPAAANVEEVEPVYIPLAGAASAARMEYSGLAVYQDMLIMLPQYPNRAGNLVYALALENVRMYLDGVLPGPLQPRPIPFDGAGLTALPGYQGLEAIVFDGNQVFITVEATSGLDMVGYLLSGEIAEDLSQISIDAGNSQELPAQAQLFNYADESLLVTPDGILTFYEANGANVNPNPVARLFSTRDLSEIDLIPLPNLEFRLTDTTDLDEEGKFWVINYLYPGDLTKLNPAADPLGVQYGTGETHAASPIIERLVEMKYSREAITFSGRPPIYLQLAEDDQARNWEGIVRLDDRGFLLVTDQYPTTILAFIPLNNP